MTPDKRELDRLFQRFMEGACTPEEKQLLWQWFFLLDARSQEMIRNSDRETGISEEMRAVIMAHVQFPKKPFFLFRRQVAAAAILIGAIITVALLLLPRPAGKDNALASFIKNESDSVRSFYLPDSTHILLNRSSSVSWKEDFNTKERRVALSGEGYFEVFPDKQHPFIVESNGIETRALGTAFVIEAYRGEMEIRVSLLHGKVEITDTGKTFRPALLGPGQLLRYGYKQRNIQIEPISVSNSLAWTAGGMTFNRIPLTEALDRLSNRYHITILYDPEKLKAKMVSGSFNAAPWEKLLPNILFVHDLKYSVRDSTITIHE